MASRTSRKSGTKTVKAQRERKAQYREQLTRRKNKSKGA